MSIPESLQRRSERDMRADVQNIDAMVVRAGLQVVPFLDPQHASHTRFIQLFHQYPHRPVEIVGLLRTGSITPAHETLLRLPAQHNIRALLPDAELFVQLPEAWQQYVLSESFPDLFLLEGAQKEGILDRCLAVFDGTLPPHIPEFVFDHFDTYEAIFQRMSFKDRKSILSSKTGEFVLKCLYDIEQQEIDEVVRDYGALVEAVQHEDMRELSQQLYANELSRVPEALRETLLNHKESLSILEEIRSARAQESFDVWSAFSDEEQRIMLTYEKGACEHLIAAAAQYEGWEEMPSWARDFVFSYPDGFTLLRSGKVEWSEAIYKHREDIAAYGYEGASLAFVADYIPQNTHLKHALLAGEPWQVTGKLLAYKQLVQEELLPRGFRTDPLVRTALLLHPRCEELCRTVEKIQHTSSGSDAITYPEWIQSVFADARSYASELSVHPERVLQELDERYTTEATRKLAAPRRKKNDRILRLAQDVIADLGIEHPRAQDEIHAVLDPLALRQITVPSPLVKQEIEKQAVRLMKILEARNDEFASDTPTIGYEIELPTASADLATYHKLEQLGTFRLQNEEGKDVEIVSHVFRDGDMAALALNSLLKSGLVARDALRPADISLHVNIGIPYEFRRTQLHIAEFESVQRALLSGHTSKKRVQGKEWGDLAAKHNASQTELGMPGRIELRANDIHDRHVYRLLKMAPVVADMYFCAVASREGIAYQDEAHRESSAQLWDALRERLGDMDLEALLELPHFRESSLHRAVEQAGAGEHILAAEDLFEPREYAAERTERAEGDKREGEQRVETPSRERHGEPGEGARRSRR